MKTDNEQIPEALNVSEAGDIESQTVEKKKSNTPLNVGMAAAGVMAGVSATMAAGTLSGNGDDEEPAEESVEEPVEEAKETAAEAGNVSAAPHPQNAPATAEDDAATETVTPEIPVADGVYPVEEVEQFDIDSVRIDEPEEEVAVIYEDGTVSEIPVDDTPAPAEPIVFDEPSIDDIQIDENLIID